MNPSQRHRRHVIIYSILFLNWRIVKRKGWNCIYMTAVERNDTNTDLEIKHFQPETHSPTHRSQCGTLFVLKKRKAFN